MRLYLDSAYVAKCYINEPDSPVVRQLVRRESGLHSSAWCLAEVACVFHRRMREKALKREEMWELLSGFRHDVESGVWRLLPVSDGVLREVEAAMLTLPAAVFLRAGDAIHLVSAREAGFDEIWTNDRRLLAAAPHFGLRGRTV